MLARKMALGRFSINILVIKTILIRLFYKSDIYD